MLCSEGTLKVGYVRGGAFGVVGIGIGPQTGRNMLSMRKSARKSQVISEADRLRIVLESFEAGAPLAVVARRNRVPPSALSRWRRNFRTGKLADTLPNLQSVPVSELAVATQRIRDLERELGRMALENAMLLEAVQFAELPPTPRRRVSTAKKRKK